MASLVIVAKSWSNFIVCAQATLPAVFPMKTDNEMAHTFEDFIYTYGAPNARFSDNGKAQIREAVKEILCM